MAVRRAVRFRASNRSSTSRSISTTERTGRKNTSPSRLRWMIARRRLSSTLRSRKNRLIWNVRTIPARARFISPLDKTDTPSSRMSPSDGVSRPEIKFTSVVLPAPFGPISAVRAPCSRTRLIFCDTRRPPNDSDTLLSSSRAVICAPAISAPEGGGSTTRSLFRRAAAKRPQSATGRSPAANGTD